MRAIIICVLYSYFKIQRFSKIPANLYPIQRCPQQSLHAQQQAAKSTGSFTEWSAGAVLLESVIFKQESGVLPWALKRPLGKRGCDGQPVSGWLSNYAGNHFSAISNSNADADDFLVFS